MSKDKIICSMLFCTLLAGGALFMFQPASAIDTEGELLAVENRVEDYNYEVTTNDLNVRSSASSKGKILGKYNKGQKIKVHSISNSWAKITYKGKTAYLHSKYIKKLQSTSTASVVYKATTDDLNIREKASGSAKILGKLNTGDTIKVSGFSGNWAKTSYKGKTGYVHKNYLTKVSSDSEIDKPTEPPIEKPEEEKPETPPVEVKYTNYSVTATETLNVRDKASTSGKVLGKLSNGSVVKVESISKGWAKVQYKNKNAYVSADYICKLIDSKSLDNIDVLVNKSNSLGSGFVPKNLRDVKVRYASGIRSESKKLRSDVASKMEKMFSDAKKANINLIMCSGYRSYSTQKSVYASNVKRLGTAKADMVSAKPGLSEHQTGLAVDILSSDYGKMDTGFEKTKAYKWLSQNAHKYGFVVRYQKGMEKVTGYSYEPWHFRYLGEDLAKYLYENKMVYEEYKK